jgi:hypothetical protein
MNMNRRQFLRASGMAAAYLALPAWLGACGRATASAGAALANPATWVAPEETPALAHLLSRISYGPRPGDLARAAQIGWDALIEQQLAPEQIGDSALDAQLAKLSTLQMGATDLLAQYPRGGKPGPRAIIQELELAAMLRACFSERQLLEIMVDFWSNHLNIYIGKNQAKWLKTVDDRDVVRKYALGKFRDLLLASAKSPAMLVYLDNAENVRPGARRGKQAAGLNENYAREVMELHTVGADGGYSQDDVHTVARVLTGWTIRRANDDAAGTFQFVPRLHDADAKNIPFLDLSFPAGGGMEEGEALLARLAAHPATAHRLAAKLCAAFVSDEPPAALIERAAQTYLASDTDVRPVLRMILQSDEFRASAGQKIKLPVRVLASAVRALGVPLNDTLVSPGRPGVGLLGQLQLLGQPFFGWQSPNGYPQVGAAWVNTGAMLARWNTAFALAEGRVRGAQPNLPALLPAGANSAGALADGLAAALVPAPLPADARAALVEYIGDGQGDQYVLARAELNARLPELAGLIMASPAFQVH